MDVWDARGTGGVVGAAWGATKVVGAARGTTEVSEVDDNGATKGGWWLDRQPLFPRWFDHPGSRSDRQPLF
jgi:hypothetical protein